MGKILSYKHGEASVNGLDPRLWDIAQASIAAMPYDAQIRSAAERGKGDKGNHSGGYAIDVTFFDKNGNRIPDTGKTGGVNSAVVYEQWAKTARAIQQEKYPELNETFRWGGGFRQGYPFDFMHLDITPSRGGSMAYYDWDTGWNSAAYSALPGLKEASGKPVPPLGLNNEAFPVTASRGIDQQRMQFEAQSQNTPLPRPRPATPASVSGAPQPSTMSPALQAARQRLTAAREIKATSAAKGDTSPAAMASTPRLTQADGQVTGIDDPRAPLDWGQFSPGAGVGGIGSLLDGGINPAAPNPVKPTTTIAGRPDAPIGSLPAASPAETKEAQRAGNIEPTPTPQTREPTFGTLKGGKQVEIGKSYRVGDKLMIAEAGPNGTATLRDVEHVRDDWMRQNVDPNANLLFEDSLAGLAARKIAAPAIKQGIGTAAGNIANTIGGAASSVADKATGLFGSTLARLTPAAKTTTGNTLTPAFVSEDHEKSNRPVPVIRPLVPPTSGNTLAKPATPAMIRTSVANPEYAAWVAKYGDGSPVQTAPTGGMITANQLAAISGSGAPVPLARPAIPVAPPRTITVMKPGNTLSAPATPSAPQLQTAQTASGKTVGVGQTYQSGGYIYSANANGSFTKIGKVGSSPSSSSSSSSSGSSIPRPSSSGSSSTTSWGAPRTNPDGTSWAA